MAFILFDLHCDTAYEIYKSKENLFSNTKSVDLEKYSCFQKKAQVFAIWSDNSKTHDENFVNFQHIANEFKAQAEENKDYISICTKAEDIEIAYVENKLACILAVEDARLLSDNLSRLERLYEFGVRILTLGWQGESCIGGSFDTDKGLTPFGFEVLKECENLGIIVDVSHLSEKGFFDVACKATKPFIASHSNSKLLCDHPRNLSDIQIRTIASCGGICGTSLVKSHLSKAFDGAKSRDPAAVFDTVCSHIEHVYNIAPENACLGLDFDGTEPIFGLESVNKIPMLFEALTNRGMDEKAAQDIFYNNAYNFFVKNL